MTSILIGLTLLKSETLKDFFPSIPGTHLSYTETGPDGRPVLTVDEVGPPTTSLGQVTVPIFTYSGSIKTSSAYYRVDDDGIYLVASDHADPLKSPMPLVKYESGKGDWDFVSVMGKGESAEQMRVHGTAKFLGQRTILDRKVDVIEVKLAARTGGGKVLLEDDQTFLYAKGMGMVELVSSSKFGKQKIQRKLRLTKIEVPKRS